jgi:predicted signal transduction protein with EAL and GGDEF domain
VPSVSIGISIGPYATADGLLRDADLALYAAEAAVKNRYIIFEPPVEGSRPAASAAPAHVVSTRAPAGG